MQYAQIIDAKIWWVMFYLCQYIAMEVPVKSGIFRGAHVQMSNGLLSAEDTSVFIL